ncbi:MAG: hypothetical protein IJY38_01070 [Clostridia bacterium]|nr:hypothetical protein [Clostridia bacterium]
MKKSYVSPKFEFLELDEEDVVRTSPAVDWSDIVDSGSSGSDMIEPSNPDNPFA